MGTYSASIERQAPNNTLVDLMVFLRKSLSSLLFKLAKSDKIKLKKRFQYYLHDILIIMFNMYIYILRT